MNVAVLGTGVVAKALAGRLSALGHAVQMGTRDPKATLARSEPDMAGGPPLRTWLEANPKVVLTTFAEAARHGELIVNALSGHGALAGLTLAGQAALAGKVMLDISNPLDFSKGMPPSLTVSNTDSLGEQVQRAFPEAKVVKTLNTVNAYLMVDPGQLAGGDHTMFVAGNDAGAKAQVTRVLQSFGWKDVVDLGDISQARGLEMYVPLWVRLYGALKSPMFNVKLVR
ncbi:MAG: NAD(P)-binding domain-containing protein [Myxococcaceae bacterium]|nr:NAD(P)-binding domain-containing protein [Myxococcaceae bacterium]